MGIIVNPGTGRGPSFINFLFVILLPLAEGCLLSKFGFVCLGPGPASRSWKLIENVVVGTGFADILGEVQRISF